MVFALIYFANLILSIIMLTERRDVETNFSWLILFSILPFIGQLIYIIIGQKYFYVTKFQRRSKLQKNYYQKLESVRKDELEKQKITEKSFSVLKQNSLINNQDLARANIQLFDNGHVFYTNLCNDLRKAKKFIHIDIYIINPGELWTEIKQILLERAKDGVEVRILVDYFGALWLKKKDVKELRDQGVLIEFFSKIVWIVVNSQTLYRNHRKCFLIDGKIAYTGGLNIGDEYVNISRKYGIWLDASIKVRGEYVSQLSSSFLKFWHFQTKRLLDKNKYAPVVKTKEVNAIAHLIETGPNSEESLLKLSIISLIGQSRKEIKIATPYFIPTESLVQTLKSALLRGVKIHIFFSGYYDWKIVWLSSLQHLFYLEKFGLVIHIVRNCLVHSKVAIFDNHIAYVGTMNFDHRSFYSQFEMANFFVGSAVEQVETLFETYKKWSLKKTFKEYRQIRQNQKISILRKSLMTLVKPYF